MSSVTNLTELNINYLTQDQYDTALANNEINENEIYMTPYQESIVDLIYPVGSIYMSVNNVNPSTFLEGTTWEQIQDRFLLAAGSTYTAGGTGGSATVKLTDAQMAHGHGFTQPSVTGGSHNHGIITRLNSGSATGYPIELSGSVKQGVGKHTEYDGGHTHTVSGGAVANLSGASSTRTAHENMPPYLTVYMWKRTA